MSNQKTLMKKDLPSEHEMMVFKVMAKGAITSKLYKGTEESIIMIMLAARELGIPPMQALNGGIYIIMGNVVISARMMNALIRKSGHSLMVEESTEKYCKIRGTRSDTKESFSSDFSLDDARRAGLVKSGSGWEKYPKDMLFARALSRVARQLFADIIGMGYVEGEIIDESKPQEEQKAPELPYIPPAEEKEDLAVTEEMAEELKRLLQKDKDFKDTVENFVLTTLQKQSFMELTPKEFRKIMKRTKEHMEKIDDTTTPA